jgi:undecaprenyl-diphosphatase
MTLQDFLFSIDKNLFIVIHHEIKNGFFDILCPILREKKTWIPLYLLVAYFIYKKYPNRWKSIFLISIIAVIVSDFLCAQILKNTIERIRPCVLFEGEWFYHNFGLCSQGTYSCPSCHAFNHASLAVFWAYLFPQKKYRILLSVWVLLIGFSQVYIGVHFPLDVVFGFLLGGMVGGMGIYIFKRNFKIKGFVA